MPEHENVYKNESEQYHALVSFEDYRNNLTRAIHQTIPRGSFILESGAGTGRVTNILFPVAGCLASFDLSHPMLKMAGIVTSISQHEFYGYSVADHRLLPVASYQFDWIVAGWSVCYLVSWNRSHWKKEVENALREFLRVLKTDGEILLIETLGTGKTSPEPPEHLNEYLDFLISAGFTREWIRTDYRFPDRQTANELTSFFFGESMLNALSRQEQPELPECTGLWRGTSENIRQYLCE